MSIADPAPTSSPSASLTPNEGVPFQSLYRRFRPQRFSEVRGQDHVSLTLRNAVASGRVTHAYLFSGPRGTGKTSTARILAKALNCTELENGEPCGHCESCKSIAAGSSFDVHELDAASNNGVEAMRDLVARASLASPGRWKVYIVDEVHMLSTAASNALLKTLEEPPDHVVFVLATTDPQKVLQTIRSRTQHYEFHLLNEDTLEALLNDVARSADLTLPDGATDFASRRGKGSARDALSALDQVAAAGILDDDTDALAKVVRALSTADTPLVIGALDEALHNGRDPYQVAIELVERLRTGFLRLVAPGVRTGAVDVVSSAEAAEVSELGVARCVRAMELVGSAIVAMRDAPDPRITLEVVLIRLTHPEAEDGSDALLDRIDRLERRIESLGTQPAASTAPQPPPRPVRAEASAAAPQAPAATTAAQTPDSDDAPSPAPAPRGEDAPSQPERSVASRPALGAFQQATPRSEQVTPPTPPRAAAPVAPVDAAPTVTGGSMPTRDAIVTAWGDRLLVGLRPKVRAIYQAGHFVGVEESTALLALPNNAHIAHAEPIRNEVESVLTAHFGCKITVRLVVDAADAAPAPVDEIETNPDPFPDTPSTAAANPPERPASRPVPAPAPVSTHVAQVADDETSNEYIPEEGVVDPQLGLTWAEDRLLQAFPGAEEIQS